MRTGLYCSTYIFIDENMSCLPRVNTILTDEDLRVCNELAIVKLSPVAELLFLPNSF